MFSWADSTDSERADMDVERSEMQPRVTAGGLESRGRKKRDVQSAITLSIY